VLLLKNLKVKAETPEVRVETPADKEAEQMGSLQVVVRVEVNVNLT
jgi:hypothetical protein